MVNHLMKGKQLYPYKMGKSCRELMRVKRYPDKIHFYNDLEGEHVDHDDWLHGKNVWNTLETIVGHGNMSLYHLHRWYLMVDVLMLADLWTWLCQTIENSFSVHPANF